MRQPSTDDKQRKEDRKDDRQRGLEDLNVTRPAPIDRETPKPKPEPAGLEDRNITKPG